MQVNHKGQAVSIDQRREGCINGNLNANKTQISNERQQKCKWNTGGKQGQLTRKERHSTICPLHFVDMVGRTANHLYQRILSLCQYNIKSCFVLYLGGWWQIQPAHFLSLSPKNIKSCIFTLCFVLYLGGRWQIPFWGYGWSQRQPLMNFRASSYCNL